MESKKSQLKKKLLDEEIYDPYERHKSSKKSKRKSKKKKSKKKRRKRKTSIPICGLLSVR